MMVLSDRSEEGSRIPWMVNMSEGPTPHPAQKAFNGKRVKIFVVPSWDKGFSTYCFQFIGQGASFCTSQNCVTAHHHASVKKVMPGKLYVAKSTTTAFVMPSITTKVIDVDVLAKWKTLCLLLSEWNKKFFIATAASDKAPASTAAMEMKEDYFRNKGLNFKTPAKCKRSPDEEESPTPLLLNISPYSPFFRGDEEAPITEIGHVPGVLAKLDKVVTFNNKAIINFMETTIWNTARLERPSVLCGSALKR
jgi:hypothetical protein